MAHILDRPADLQYWQSLALVKYAEVEHCRWEAVQTREALQKTMQEARDAAVKAALHAAAAERDAAVKEALHAAAVERDDALHAAAKDRDTAVKEALHAAAKERDAAVEKALHAASIERDAAVEKALHASSIERDSAVEEARRVAAAEREALRLEHGATLVTLTREIERARVEKKKNAAKSQKELDILLLAAAADARAASEAKSRQTALTEELTNAMRAVEATRQQVAALHEAAARWEREAARDLERARLEVSRAAAQTRETNSLGVFLASHFATACQRVAANVATSIHLLRQGDAASAGAHLMRAADPVADSMAGDDSGPVAASILQAVALFRFEDSALLQLARRAAEADLSDADARLLLREFGAIALAAHRDLAAASDFVHRTKAPHPSWRLMQHFLTCMSVSFTSLNLILQGYAEDEQQQRADRATIDDLILKFLQVSISGINNFAAAVAAEEQPPLRDTVLHFASETTRLLVGANAFAP